MLNVRFPKEFAHTLGSVSEVNVSCDVYSDDYGLAYWIYADDSAVGKKGDLMQIEYGPNEQVKREIEGPVSQANVANLQLTPVGLSITPDKSGYRKLGY